MREGNASRARDLFEEALRLWRGDALADVMYEEFAQPDIGRLNEARLDATEARIDADLLLGRDSGMISEIERLVRAHPLREHLRAQLMLALSRSGRQAEALRSYQSAREVLGEQLGLEPSSELRALEAAILQQEDAVVRRDAPVASPPRTNLRTPLTSIIGRRGAMRALRPLLRAHRLVTLVGPGGVGKSRLVLEAAREWFDSDEGDVWMVEFADVGDTNGVAAAILATLDVARAGEAQGDIRRLIEFLGKRRAVLVFDNCEHLVASAAHVAQELLESCPTLTIWATSREGLSIPGEVLWPVPPLVLDDAVALFIERGLAADPVGAFGDDSAPARRALEEICTRLDGLPLAIELAAARLRTIPIGELMTGLEDRFRILNRGARTALPRQQTLRAVVDWSYDLLFDDERRVFDRLSVFRGSCTLAAAKAVCSDDDITGDDVTDLVSRLADKSLALIQSDELGGYARCRMLQTLVEYGRERLEESGDAARRVRRARPLLLRFRESKCRGTYWSEAARLAASGYRKPRQSSFGVRRRIGRRRRRDRTVHRWRPRLVLVVHRPRTRRLTVADARTRLRRRGSSSDPSARKGVDRLRAHAGVRAVGRVRGVSILA